MAPTHRLYPVLFAFFMSLFMASIMSGIITAINTGLEHGFFFRWGKAFLIAWSCAFPVVLIVAPRVRILLAKLPDF